MGVVNVQQFLSGLHGFLPHLQTDLPPPARMESSLHYTSVNHADCLIGSINQLRRKTELCDVLLNVGSRRIPAHRLILSACMPYFHNLLEHNPRETPAEYHLTDVDPDAAQSIIEFCYTSAISVTEENVLTLLPTAFMFQLDEISNLCCDFLLSQLRPDTCLVTYQVATQCDCKTLQEDSVAFIKENFQKILAEETFLDLAVYSLLQTLKSLQGEVLSDKQVLDAIQTWVDHCGEDRQQSAPLVAHFFPDLFEKLKEFLPEELLQLPLTLDDMDTSSPVSRPDDTSTSEDSFSMSNGGLNNSSSSMVTICTICGEIFDNQKMLDQHKRDCEEMPIKPEFLHVNDNTITISTGSPKGDNGFSGSHFSSLINGHTCPICNKSFSDKKNLSKHIKIHSQSGFSCEFCLKKYSTKSNLQGHMRVHSGDRPFSCEFCGKNFSTYCVMRVHLHTHTGEKPFPCPTCGVSFAKNIHLKRHMQIHTGAKPHVCNICGKHFSRSDHVKRHIQSIHSGAKPHTCTLCGKEFVRKYELNKHMKLHFAQSVDGHFSNGVGFHEFENGNSSLSETSLKD
ncbi:myoneurin-like isoform X1 [Haliotis asinina]|uniref:myoneurin-like isoform X1 n=2 Tax=Haliotis asinina TaxID=109174 RepID=UPI0035321445